MNMNTAISVAGAAFGLLGLLAAAYIRGGVNEWRARCVSMEASLAGMRRELELAASISMKTGARVNRIEQEYSGVADRVDVVELRGAAQSFNQAIDSARRGADPGRLAQQFGLSRGEAELVTRLHGRKHSG